MVHLYRYILHKRDHRVNIKNGNGNDPFPRVMDGEFGARGGEGGWEKRAEKEGETEKPRKLKTDKIIIKGYPPQIDR